MDKRVEQWIERFLGRARFPVTKYSLYKKYMPEALRLKTTEDQVFRWLKANAEVLKNAKGEPIRGPYRSYQFVKKKEEPPETKENPFPYDQAHVESFWIRATAPNDDEED